MKITQRFETGSPDGKMHTVRIGDHTITAGSKAHLQIKVNEAINKAFTEPKIGIAKVGNQVMVVVEHLGVITTYAADISVNGVCETRQTDMHAGDPDFAETVDRAALHLFKCDPESWEGLMDGTFPNGMPLSQIHDWKWYTRNVKEETGKNS
jgi:hypothetical protein